MWTRKAPNDVDAYLATLSPDKRAALQKLRRTIKAAAPKVEECISYGMPAFRLNEGGPEGPPLLLTSHF